MAFVLPIALCTMFCFATDLVSPPGTFGISSPHQVRTLGQALEVARHTGRHKIVLVNNDNIGENSEQVLRRRQKLVEAQHAPAKIVRVPNTDDIKNECVANAEGATSYFAAVIAHSSADQASGAIWNYTIRAGAAFASSPLVFNTATTTNPEQVYILPLKRAIDAIIAQVEPRTTPSQSLANIAEIAFTSDTQEQRES